MPNIQQVGFQSPGYDYEADLSQIERKRRLAEALQAQSLEPLQSQSSGGWAVPTSPLQGLAKLAQAWTAGKTQKNADEQQRALATKAQDDYKNMITSGLAKLQGTPVSEDAAGNISPAQAPDPMGALSAFGSHPMGAQFAPLAMSEISRQRLAEALRAGNKPPQANPMAPGQGASVMAGSGATVPQSAPQQAGVPGGPAGGQPLEFWLQIDPTGKLYGEQLAKDRAPINVRPGGTVYIPGQGPQYTAPQGGIVTTQGEGGPRASLMPGYSAAQEALHSIPNPSAPLIPVKTSSGQDIQLTQPEYVAWQKSGQLPARYGQQAPAQPQPATPLPANVPPEHAAAYQTVLDASRRGVTASAKVPDAGLGTVGATQSQADQITQARQQAGGKAVDEAFGKDYVAFKTGGAQDSAKQLAQLQDVTKALQNQDNELTGPIRGRLPDVVRGVTNPQAIAMRERVEEVVQRSLRAILGAQFTEKEGERLISRAYNPAMSQQENAVRVNRLLTQLKQAYQSKVDAADFFEKNGTLSGWQGKLPSMSDFDPDKSGNLVKDVLGSNDAEALVKKWLR